MIADNKNLRKLSNHSFQTRSLIKIDIISLTEDVKIINEDLQTAEIFNNYFSNVIQSLCNLNICKEPGIGLSQNTVSTAISKFRNHPSILSINKRMERQRCPSFVFEFASLEETIKEVYKYYKSFSDSRCIKKIK